nr:polyprotein [Sobelivirales sp.]
MTQSKNIKLNSSLSCALKGILILFIVIASDCAAAPGAVTSGLSSQSSLLRPAELGGEPRPRNFRRQVREEHQDDYMPDNGEYFPSDYLDSLEVLARDAPSTQLSPPFVPVYTEQEYEETTPEPDVTTIVKPMIGGWLKRPPGIPSNEWKKGAIEELRSVETVIAKTIENKTAEIVRTINETQKAVLKAYSTVGEFFQELIDVVAHPIDHLLKTKTGTMVLIFLVLAILFALVRFVGPSVRMLYGFICIISRWLRRAVGFLISPFYFLIHRSACCMRLCAITPLVIIRNKITSYRMGISDRKRMKVFNPEELQEMVSPIKRTYAAGVEVDEHGAYLDAGNNHRIYLNLKTIANDLTTLSCLAPPPNRESGAEANPKETIIASSKLYKQDKIPDFQGTFQVDGMVVGHFSRIMFQGKDCILTAYHVLDYNKDSLLSLVKGQTAIQFETVKTNIVCFSKSEELDFIIIEIPSYVFSTLKMKVGTWTPRVHSREVVTIHQYFQGKPCFSCATVSPSNIKPWHISYHASTTTGTSGAPLVDSRNRIIGIHIEHDQQGKCNVGVVPPVFRNTKKESATNEDMFNHLDYWEEPSDSDEEEQEGHPDYRRKETPEERAAREKREAMEEGFRVHYMEIADHTLPWSVQLDWVEENVKRESARGSDRKQFKTYVTGSGAQGNNVGEEIKHGRRMRGQAYTSNLAHEDSVYYDPNKDTIICTRKESPWTCSVCHCIHTKKGYTCTNCGFALIPLTEKRLAERRKGTIEATNIIRNKVPEEIVEKIILPVKEHDLAGEVALKVCEMLKTTPNIYPTLPGNSTPVIKMDKNDAQRLATAPDAPMFSITETGNDSKVYPVQVRNGNLTVLTGKFNPDGWDPMEIKPVHNLLAKIDPIKKSNKETVQFSEETSVVPKEIVRPTTSKKAEAVSPHDMAKMISEQVLKVLNDREAKPTKSASRRQREKARKETIQSEEQTPSPAVHLNSKAPATAGDLITIGTNKRSRSRTRARKLAPRSASSKAVSNKKSPINGKPSANLIPATKRMPGPTGAQQQKRSVSSSKLTST